MIILFEKNDDFTLALEAQGYLVEEEFVEGTTIPLGYTVSMRHLRFVYHVNKGQLFLIRYFPLRLGEGLVGGTLRELYQFFSIATRLPSIVEGKVMVNKYPESETQKREQALLLRFAARFDARLVPGGPVDFVLIDLTKEYNI